MSRKLKHVQVKEALREHIRTRHPVGSKIPSTTDLHKTFGVSQGTINRALRDLVEEGIIERFEGRGTFVSRGNKHRGFLWPDGMRQWSKDPYPAGILHAAEQESHRRKKHILVGAVRDSMNPEFTGEGSSKVAGVMILFNHDHRVVEEYHRRHVPVVLVDPLVRTTGVPFVTSDHFSAGREATSHLIRLGHRRIVHVSLRFPFSSLPVEERILGYKEAMRESGLEETTRVHVTSPLQAEGVESQEERAGREASIGQFLEMLETVQPTACFCYDDLLAASVIHVFHDNGIRVPDDVSVVGINDGGMATQIWPALTTVHLPVDEIGEAAVRMLDTLIEHDQLTGGGEILGVHLVERASTNRPPDERVVQRLPNEAAEEVVTRE